MAHGIDHAVSTIGGLSENGELRAGQPLRHQRINIGGGDHDLVPIGGRIHLDTVEDAWQRACLSSGSQRGCRALRCQISAIVKLDALAHGETPFRIRDLLPIGGETWLRIAVGVENDERLGCAPT